MGVRTIDTVRADGHGIKAVDEERTHSDDDIVAEMDGMYVLQNSTDIDGGTVTFSNKHETQRVAVEDTETASFAWGHIPDELRGWVVENL